MTFTRRLLAPTALTFALLFAGTACGSSDNSSASSPFCEQIEDLDESDDLQFQSLSDEEAARRLTQAFEELKESAPAEIESSVKELSDTINALAEAASDPVAVAELNEALDQEKVDVAWDEVADYTMQHCGIDLDG